MRRQENAALRQVLLKLYEECHFQKFDEFMVRRFVPCEPEEPLTDELRRQAYQTFHRSIQETPLANPTTMRRWFGISGIAKPSRIQIYQMAVLLHLSREETEQYLTVGLHECSFWINDYQEIIYLYGIENALSLEQCQHMIDAFEQELAQDFQIEHTGDTRKLTAQFEQKKKLSIEEFLLFLRDNRTFFKGYSRTALTYLLEYRDQTLALIREDAKVRLNELLAETSFSKWKAKTIFRKKKDPYQLILSYLNSRYRTEISSELADNILELARLAYSTLRNNSLVRSEIFGEKPQNYSLSKRSEVRYMSMKHMSDMLSIARQKEEAAKVQEAVWNLKKADGSAPCPNALIPLILPYIDSDQDRLPQKCTCDQALACLVKYQNEHKRRQPLVQRGDILPFVLYVSQQSYLQSIRGNPAGYRQQEARRMFCEAADNVLTACNMLPLQENLELDAVLLACYQEEDMYSYSDVLEALYVG